MDYNHEDAAQEHSIVGDIADWVMEEVPEPEFEEPLPIKGPKFNEVWKQVVVVAETDQQVIVTLKKISDGNTGNSDSVDSMVLQDLC